MTILQKFEKSGNTGVQVMKVNADMRLVFGWAQVCKIDGEQYYDTDTQGIPEQVALESWNEFMQTAKVMKAMHSGDQMGEVRFAFPLLEDISKSLGVETNGKTGIVVAVYVSDDDTLAKFQSGEFKDFSIGGGANWEDVE